MTFQFFSIALGLVVIIIDGFFAAKADRKGDIAGKYLRNTFLFSIGVTVFYLISIQMTEKNRFAVSSAVYFCLIDAMLYSLLHYVIALVKFDIGKGHRKWLQYTLTAAISLDIILELANPFLGYFAIEYIPGSMPIPAFEYVVKPLYTFHLALCYLVVVLYLALIIYRCMIVPGEYKLQYILSVFSIVSIVGMNALFLYLPQKSVFTNLDYSIIGYSIAELFLYWTHYSYATVGMMTHFKNYVFSNIDQGIVLFDFDNNMILWNEKARKLLPGISFSRFTGIETFTDYCGIDIDRELHADSRALQCFIRDNDSVRIRPLRCDYRTVENKSNALLGRLFVFSDATMDTDLLTGFHSWERFGVYAEENSNLFEIPSVVSVCDINGLLAINNTLGRETGDRKIRQLAKTMKNILPAATYYVRGPEANLIAITAGFSKESIIQNLLKIQDALDVDIQFAIDETGEEAPSVTEAITRAISAMKNQKLLNRKSSHSGTLSSLITALQECDNETEAHVQRTRKIGQELGKRIGLSDLQQSQLSLLCLMHDIGKIGVPLEILNKPTKLTEAEIVVVRSHVKKGYQICQSSAEVCEIADMVLHHHERWDGKGYPDGQSKETIPLLSRVISVIDAYDAMVSNRAYSPAKTEKDAQRELIQCAGTQFDPTIVNAFVKLVQEIHFYGEEDPSEIMHSPDTVSLQTNREQDNNMKHVHQVQYASYVFDSSMRIISVDERFEEITGYSWEDVQERKLTHIDLIPPEDHTEYLFAVNTGKNRTAQAFFEHMIMTKAGLRVNVICYGRDYYDPVAKDMRTQIIIADSLQTYSAQYVMNYEQDKAIKRLAKWEETYRRDSLTGLLKHEAFRNDVELRLLDSNIRVLMLMIDVDNFKGYNDTYGHHLGDELLICLASNLREILRTEDLACRMGGDEFSAALFFNSGVSDDQIYRRAEQIYDLLLQKVKSSTNNATFSMGAVIAHKGDSFTDIYESSDKALYRSKDSGRGKMSIGRE